MNSIYSKKITNWKEIGGFDKEIQVFQRNDDSGSQTLLKKFLFNDMEYISPFLGRMYHGMSEMVDDVNDANIIDKYPLGYSMYYYVKYMHQNSNVKILAVSKIEPSEQTIRSGQYPFVVKYYIVTVKNRVTCATKKVMNFVLSQEGQKLVSKCGYVNLKYSYCRLTNFWATLQFF